MAPTFSSDTARRLRPAHAEQPWLLATVVVLVAELGALALMIGTSDRFDTRFLLAEHHLRLAALARRPLRPGDTLILGNGVPSGQIDLDGAWSVGDPTGVWTDGASAGFTVATLGPANGHRELRLAGTVMPGRRGGQELTLSVDGSVVSRRTKPGGAAVLFLPIDASPSGSVRLVHATIGIGDPTRPSAADTRRLGFHLRSVSLLATPDVPNR